MFAELMANEPRKKKLPLRGEVRDKLHRDKCRTCGKLILIGTDGDGHMVGQDPRTLDRHACRRF